ncbi:ATP-binding cassette sub-family C member 5-like isoform X2 [Neodiprion fabricii]|uniref:ATP-binding cassette sub-family C member 5-like isoform X2 n=1 Tax=Neodiprion fabricii TaxID=2872261 RepID=UPI001ED8D174|nr:ATP-binding cassette sub-family C member 5-like isoform X2 [Neodiprion fabricii]
MGPNGNRTGEETEGQDAIEHLQDHESKNTEIVEKNLNLQSIDQHLFKHVSGRGLVRYKNAAKNLIPIRRKKKGEKVRSIDSAGLFSIISYSWVSKLMYKAYSKGISINELPDVSPYDTCTHNTERLELLWNQELTKMGPEKVSLGRVAWQFCRTRILFFSIVYTGSLICGFATSTLFMRKLIEYVQSERRSYTEGLKWAFLLTAIEFSRALLLHWAWGLSYRTALRLRSACCALLFKKIIRLNYLGDKSIGQVINMFSNDSQRIYDAIVFGPMIIAGPITTVWGVCYILWVLSPMALLGMITFLLFYPVQYAISYYTGYLRSKSMNISDFRVRLTNEILECIKLIKMYAWEKRFSQDLLDVRKKEQTLLLKTACLQCLSICTVPTIPVISAIISFLAHIAAGNNITAAQAFPLSTFFGTQIRQALMRLRDASQTIVESMVAFRRIKSVLLLEDGSILISKPILKSQAVAINHGTFACNAFDAERERRSHVAEKERQNDLKDSRDKSENEKLSTLLHDARYIDVLFDITFEATKGKLVGICGHVGSGKSSLLLAALGQLRVVEGQVMRDGSCAYVSQQAWIINATLQENILFGAQFDHSRYFKAIYASNLSQDIAEMPGGDQTEIGEKGVNLSGGQKQRVALARALYADRDIYFLDDPLSAVDTRVGAHIFHKLIRGALKGKTVLFVTHQVQYLNHCDDIYMMHDGRIIEHGTHDELMKLGNEYALMVTAISANDETDFAMSMDEKIGPNLQSVDNSLPDKENEVSSPGTDTNTDTATENDEILGTPVLTIAEDLQKGTIKVDTYHSYIMAAGGYFFSCIVILTFAISVGSSAFSSWWLALWIKAGNGLNTTAMHYNATTELNNINDNPDFWYYQAVYGSTIGLMLFTSLLRSLVLTRATLKASTTLHNDLFQKIIQCPMRFFDTTPTGRIQHLFSRDMDEVDNRLPISLTSLMQNLFVIFFAILVICLVLPWFILPVCILAIVYYFVSKVFRVAARDLKRMENKSRAPIISYVTATVQGLSTIHAFEKETEFLTKFNCMFDENSQCMFMCSIAMRWLAVRVDCLSATVIAITAFLVIALQGELPPALAGLALSYAAHISGVFQYTIRLASETEVKFISVERINHYLRTLVGEGNISQRILQPPSGWPVAASIKFQNVSMAYGEEAPIILKNVSFNVDAGEKIGIVGRTGSGKSSLTAALFRLVELTEGKIEIDNVDISEINLGQLRTKLSIIPQDPILFNGSIRSNLDPFKRYTDSEIWRALEKTKLKNRVQSINGHLDASVGYGGDNLSVGERQLLCLSRALLRESKILVMDEATAAVDPETEIAVQTTIQQEFSFCTILIIAHRLQTVLFLDRVLVMNSGKILEFDKPYNLLKDPNSEFSKMIAGANTVENK